MASLFPTPASPVLASLATGLGVLSLGLQGEDVFINGKGYGWHSKQFHESLGVFFLGGVFFGKGKILEKVGGRAVAETVGAKAAGAVEDGVVAPIGALTW